MGLQKGVQAGGVVGDGGMRGESGSWWIRANGVIALLGLALSIYSSYHHRLFWRQGGTDLSCNINAQINCDAVAASSYSEFFGIPLGDYGVGFYVALLVVLGLIRFGLGQQRYHIRAYGLLVAAGAGSSLVLAAISLLQLHVLCLVCFGLYLVNGILVGLAIKEHGYFRGFWSPVPLIMGALEVLVVMGLVVGGISLGQPNTRERSSVDKSSSSAPQGNGSASSLDTLLAPQSREIPLATSPYASSGLGEDYRQGNDTSAKVTIMTFSDFECPACKGISSLLHDIENEFGDAVRIVFRNYPLDNSCNKALQRPMHQEACKIAVLARCAGQHEKFWQFHDLAFKNQKAPGQQPEDWAQEVGLAPEEISACLASESILAKIKDDIALGGVLGVESTPTLFVNNRKFIGQWNELAALVRLLVSP